MVIEDDGPLIEKNRWKFIIFGNSKRKEKRKVTKVKIFSILFLLKCNEKDEYEWDIFTNDDDNNHESRIEVNS